jgi:hypothetical protein
MKNFITLIALFLFTLSLSAQSLKISLFGRYIEKADDTPFLWIGDTGWELFHRLNREEATDYLTTRAKQGFTVIQAVVLAEQDGLRTPNPYGELPLTDLDPEKPNEKYFEHVDFIVNKANELGLVVGILPTWGDKVYSLHPGAGPIVFNKQNAEVYGRFLGKRYKENDVVWILGGDRNVANLEVLEIWRAMAKGLDEGDGGNHLITFHPRGESSSSYWLHNEDWLDFNMYQSGHARRFNHVYRWAEADRNKHPVKPVLDGEPAYEDIAVKFWDYCDWSNPRRAPEEVLDEDGIITDPSHFKEGFFIDYDVRVHAYWDFLSGACGYTYGNNAVWQMYKKGGTIAIPCLSDWRDALDHKGANQLIHLKKLLEQYPISDLVPDQSVIYGPIPEGKEHIRAVQSYDDRWILIYLSTGQSVKVVMSKLSHPTVKARWYDPRTGTDESIGYFPNQGIREFSPPSSGIGNDWMLIIE